MSVYDRANNADGYGEMPVRCSDQRVEVAIVTREGYATVILSPQDARRMGEALIELAKANGA